MTEPLCRRQNKRVVAPQKPHFLIVPGLGNSGADHWQSIWAGALDDVGRVEQQDWDRPDLDDWLQTLTSRFGFQPGSVVIAHSLGCVLVVHAVARDPDLPINGGLLVAPADVDCSVSTPDSIRGFAPMPTATLPFPTIVIAGVDGPRTASNVPE